METIPTSSYQPPVATLLTYGECQLGGPSKWPNYLELGLGPEHIPDLIRMATDEELNLTSTNKLEVYAPTHAWRALGRLRAEAAIEPLLGLYDILEDDDWIIEELPDVFGMIGPATLPTLATWIADDVSRSNTERINAMSSVVKVGSRWPEARTQCVELLTRQLELLAANDPEINGFLILDLVKLQATEAIPLIERAFAMECVDLMIMGDWDDVQVELGLKSPEEIPLRRYGFSPATTSPLTVHKEAASSLSSIAHRERKADRKKAKSKMIKQSRKKNRK